MSAPLSDATLGSIDPRVEQPGYDRSIVTPGIVHLGIGAFHRAHQAAFTDDCLWDGESHWGIVGVSLRSRDTRDALKKQDCLYTLAIRDGDRQQLRVIGSICDILVVPENPALVLEVMSSPDIRIVSLTVTEKAYFRNAAGDLDFGHRDILADLADPRRPRTIFGLIVGAIEQRRLRRIKPFTVMSCDNLAANGRTLHRLLVQFATRRSEELADFIRDHVSCPSTMVDRIVPATTALDRSEVAALLGAEDAWPVACEPFSQWVIEDDFPSGRPSWEHHGATFVNDVEPFELMKLRLLNGAHSAIAYLGQLLRHETVADSFSDPRVARFVRALWRELIPTLQQGAGLKPAAYVEDLALRFGNSALKHRTAQIANDGSQKLPQRIVAAAMERLDRGEPVDHLAFVVAAWIAALLSRQRDTFTDALDRQFANLDPSSNVVEQIFTIAGFASGDPHRIPFAKQVATHLARIDESGVAAALGALNGKA
ncbi:mannitol dehydrogenase family protein [Rhizobium metallidurans]|uniref:Fructuronate reductase n=1 Tax=Rhizobium metallidurans TaxID=1265931 RepID=A0A7W6G9E8_9HYPH|nr:mannitol dehydrogenase family protein [Rhizobium metallidurans]MBB3962815.1 fructuronate reductase [Rhizobium metallidurans]